MMPAHPTDLLEAYVLRLLSPTTEAEIDAHLSGCRACQAEVASLTTTLGALAYAAPAQTPSAQVEDRLFARIAAAREEEHQLEPTAPKMAAIRDTAHTGKVMPMRRVAPASRGPHAKSKSRVRWAVPLSVAAALVAVLLVAVLLTQQHTPAARTLSQQAVAALHAAHPQTFTLNVTQDGPKDATAAMAMDPAQNRGVLVVAHLPPLPAGKTYEFWLVQTATDGKAATNTPSGTFSVRSDGSGMLFFTSTQPISTLLNAGVSLERAGGVLTPDSPMLLLIKD